MQDCLEYTGDLSSIPKRTYKECIGRYLEKTGLCIICSRNLSENEYNKREKKNDAFDREEQSKMSKQLDFPFDLAEYACFSMLCWKKVFGQNGTVAV